MGAPNIVIPGDLDQQRGYKIGKFREFYNYECLKCQYSTLFERRMIVHVQEGKHPWAFPNEGPKPGKAHDGFGPEEVKPATKLVY